LETLELLEELLLDYHGTVLFISHDREFINNIATGTFIFEGDGFVKEYAGGYDDWIAQRKTKTTADPTAKKLPKKPRKKNNDEKPPRLTYAQQIELEKLPLQIEKLEEQLAQIHQQLADPDLYKKPPEIINQLKSDAQNLEAKLQSTYAHWEELEQFNQ
ncbi:MAG: ABC transporter ATP-binding protein, partial [Planctomycetes bacterium]|nr:ABC transporter ATP-binding protein [Planctomycetota bacterium]